jgi:hypothetical protein
LTVILGEDPKGRTSSGLKQIWVRARRTIRNQQKKRLADSTNVAAFKKTTGATEPNSKYLQNLVVDLVD